MRPKDVSIQQRNNKESNVTYFTLFATTGTLLCCALPIAFSLLGLGASWAALTGALPFITTIGLYKEWLFIGSALLLSLSGWLIYRPGRACPTDSELGKKCSSAHKWNKRIYWSSVIIWCVGFFAAYLALPLRIWLDF